MKEFHSPDRTSATKIPEKFDYDKKRIHYIARAKHTHLGVEMTYVISGEAFMTIYPDDGSDPVTARVKKGCYTLLTYGTSHSFRDGSRDFAVINILVSPVLLDPSLRAEATPDEIEKAVLFDDARSRHIPFNRVCYDCSEQLEDKFEQAVAIKGRYRYGFRAVNRALIIEILVISLNQSALSGRRRKDSIAEIVREYVNVHFSEQISLTELSERYHYTPPYVSKRFRQEYGESFEQYLQKVRMRHACDLLLETDYSIERISELVSYSTPIPFRRAFRKHFGITPTEYRQRGDKKDSE